MDRGKNLDIVTRYLSRGDTRGWEGPGGVLETADQAEENGKKDLMKWLRPKRDYKKLVAFLLSTRLHMIPCSRAKQAIVEAVVDGQKMLLTQPWEPIQDKRLKYEMTIVVPMTLDGDYETDPSRLKVPGDLAPVRGPAARREHRRGHR